MPIATIKPPPASGAFSTAVSAAPPDPKALEKYIGKLIDDETKGGNTGGRRASRTQK